MAQEPFEIWETPDKRARFVFSYSDNQLTTGCLILQPGSSLPKHNRPLGFESLTQLAGISEMTVFDTGNIDKVLKAVKLEQGSVLKMDKGQWHIHANPYSEISITFFKLIGDITQIMKTLRASSSEVKLRKV